LPAHAAIRPWTAKPVTKFPFNRQSQKSAEPREGSGWGACVRNTLVPEACFEHCATLVHTAWRLHLDPGELVDEPRQADFVALHCADLASLLIHVAAYARQHLGS